MMLFMIYQQAITEYADPNHKKQPENGIGLILLPERSGSNDSREIELIVEEFGGIETECPFMFGEN